MDGAHVTTSLQVLFNEQSSHVAEGLRERSEGPIFEGRVHHCILWRRETAQDVFDAAHADSEGVPLLLHDQMDENDRNQVLKTLREAGGTKQLTLLCTDLAARGLDVENVRHVILYDVPADLSAFVHQAGRTARRGTQGLLTCLVKTQSNEMGRYTKLHTLKDAQKLNFQ